MVLSEIKLKMGREFSIKVKGTDLNPIALKQASSGIYSSKVFKEMKPELIKKYFMQEGDHYVVNDAIQSLCEFEQASVFGCDQAGTIDLVSCRNLLIYLKSPLQAQLIEEFHQTLVPGGLLFLGQSESLSPSSHTKFKQVDLTHRLYMRR
jgi:chemotaxis protein methyltransferase CheR/two-component system CheB/CheR fusion protein